MAPIVEAASHDAVKFDVSKDDDGVDDDDNVTRNELRAKNRRRASPPPQLYEQIDNSSTGLNGKSSCDPLSCSTQESEKTTDKESCEGADRWILRSAPPHNPIAPHPRSMTARPALKSSPPASRDEERAEDQGSDMDLPSIVSMEILESAIIAEKRIKREEVEQRVAEMHRIVADAQHYLTETESSTGSGDQDRNNHSRNNKETQVSDDSESLKSDPDFTATDSLLLIRHTTDGRELDLSNSRVPCVESGPCFSESDTTSDSYSNASGASPLDRTPNGSFKNQISVKRDCTSLSEILERTFSHSVRENGNINGTSDISFASEQRLDQDEDESPDVSESAPNLSDAENELIEALKRLQTEEECYLELPFMHSTAPCMTQDQEIIDLTAFPPPGEHEDQYDNLQQISGPGRGYHLGQAGDPYSQDDEGVEYANFTGPSSVSLVNRNLTPYSTLTRVTSNCLPSVQQQASASVSSSSSVTCDDSRSGTIASIDDFIASVSIPPPPLTVRHNVLLSGLHHQLLGNENDEDDDLSSLIVPPPPVEEKSYPQDDVIAKFWQVTDDVKKIYETLPGRTCSSSNNHVSSNGLLQVSPKSGTRELHSSSSGDSGYESIPVMPHAAASSSCKQHVPLPAVPVACDSDAFTLRLVLSSASSSASCSNGNPAAASSSASSGNTKPAGGRLSLSTVCQSSESNNGNQMKGKGREAAENGTACNTNAGIGFVRADAIASSPPLSRPLLPTTSIVSNSVLGTDSSHLTVSNKDLVTPTESDLYSSSTDGLRRKKIPPPPPVRSKPPIPPTSPSIIERRRQLAKKAQTKAKLGMVPVQESAAAGEEEEADADEEDDSLMRMRRTMHDAASSPSHEVNAAIVFNEGRGDAADQSQIFTDDGLDPSSCLLEEILDKKHFPSHQMQQFQHLNAAREWNGMQEHVMDSNTLFVQVQANIDQLLNRLEDVHETRIRSDPSSDPAAGSGHFCRDERILNQRKDELVIESRAFVTSSKLFVKCATEGSPHVIDHLLDCLSLLDHMCKVAEVIVMSTESQAQVTCLVDRLKEVAVTFGYTIATVHKLTEQEITDPLDSNYMTKRSAIPSMSQLMNHATSLATSLSALMRTLRAFSSY